MGRKIPTGENPLLVHPAIALSLLTASIAATIAIITALCGARSRRKASPDPSSASPHNNTTDQKSEVVTPPQTTTTPSTVELLDDNTTTDKSPEPQDRPLKPPPMHQLRESTSYSHMPRLPSSSNMKVPRSMSVAKYRSRKEEKQRKKEKIKPEESIWTKTIILGEKCKVPEEDDTILYDDKGNRISTYHPKTPSSLPVSRANSYIDPEAVPS